MALDGLILHNIIASLQELCPIRINKIAQISQKELVFTCYSQQRYEILISTDSESNRLLVTNHPFQRTEEPSHFVMLLRKHCENGYIQSIQQSGLDRIAEFTISNRNALGDLVEIKLVVELMGKYANIILVDEKGIILDAFHRIAPFENTQRTIFSGALFEPVAAQDKHDPRIVSDYTSERSLTAQFEGFSPLFSKEMEYRLRQNESFDQIIKETLSSKNIYAYDKHYHVIELKHLHQAAKIYPLMEGLDIFYQQQVQHARIKQHTGNLFRIIKRELRRNRNKLVKLEDQLEQAYEHQHLQDLGNLLLTYGQDLPNGLKEVELIDFNNQPITVELDERLNGLENANKYFTRYHKQKNAQKHLALQIQQTQYQIEYFENLNYQLEHASLDIAKEIRQELIDHKVIWERSRKKSRKKAEESQFHGYWYHDVLFIYGKSNQQNEQITFKLSRKNEYWFHVQNAPGAHVLVKTDQLNEAIIRFAANVAAYHSSYQKASSVPVDYTTIDQIKKIPQAPLGLVSIKQYKTIFIDPVDPLTIEGVSRYTSHK